jgi:SAM-dependent methyltransferase
MHAQALAFYLSHLADMEPLDVLEFGSCNLNGSVRDIYQARSWHGIDVAEGAGVDEVADAATWSSDRRFDIVICAEVFEHTPDWREIIDNARRHLVSGGMFLATCATACRPAHSAVDGGALRDGEHYANVELDELCDHMDRSGWSDYLAGVTDGYFGNDDLQVVAFR